MNINRGGAPIYVKSWEEYGREVMCVGYRHAVEDGGAEVEEGSS
jgi:hypothetical protein